MFSTVLSIWKNIWSSINVWAQVWDLSQQATTMVKKFTYKVGKYNVLVPDAGSNLRYFDFWIKCPTDLQAKPIHEMGSYLNNILIAFSKCFFVDSDYG